MRPISPLSAFISVAALGLFSCNLAAQTIVSGTVNGTWSISGSPYVVADNCTVPAGQNLKIDPGVSVVIGSNLSLNVYGRIEAIGTYAQHIIVMGATSEASYDRVFVNYSSNQITFEYCDFSNARRGLWFEAYAAGGTFAPKVSNCTFSNCWGAGIVGHSFGGIHTAQYAGDATYPLHSYLNPFINNCTFSLCGLGCGFWIHGSSFDQPFLHVEGYGYASPIIRNSLFYGITNIAVQFYSENLAGASAPSLANNTMADCNCGLDTEDPYNATVKNNIFVDNETAVRRTGTLSGTLGFNCFFQNQTNFLGYPASFGLIVTQNANGTPCDVTLNIFQDPLFEDTISWFLATNSPCVDAGDPAPAYLDGCFPPSLGTTVNDMGLFGGPEACDWLANTSTNFSVGIKQLVAVTINPNLPGRYRLEYTPSLPAQHWTQLTNLVLQAIPYTYIDYDSSTPGNRFYRAVLLP